MKTASQQEIALITVTILHHVKTTFVLETGSSASLEFLVGKQLLSEAGVLLLSREGNTNNVSPFSVGFILLFSKCLIQSLMETCPSSASHRPCTALGDLYSRQPQESYIVN